MTEATPKPLDLQTATEIVQTHLDGLDRVAAAHGGQSYVFSDEEILLADAMRELLADRVRMAAELEQVRKAHRRQLGSAIFWRRRAFQLADLIPAEQIPDPEWDDDSSVARRAERNEELRNALAVAVELIDRLVDDDACEIDHNGYCQLHNLHSEPCPHPLGRRFVEAWDAVAAETTATRPADGPAVCSCGCPLGQRCTCDYDVDHEDPTTAPAGTASVTEAPDSGGFVVHPRARPAERCYESAAHKRCRNGLAVTVPIPERHPAGRSCAGVAATLAAVATMLATLTRRNTR